MRRVIDVILIVLGTFYLALIYNSKSLVFLGWAEIFIIILLFFYNLLVFSKIRIMMEVPLGITELQKKVPIRIIIYNYSMLPTGRIWIQLMESYALENKKKKTVFGVSVAGRKRNSGQAYAMTVIHALWQPQYIGKAVVRLKKVRCFDMLGVCALPLPKRAYQAVEEITVLPKIYPVPVEIGTRSRDFAVEQERYMTDSREENSTEQFWIREYRQGDRLRNIHWKLSAKEDDLMVREYLPTIGCPILLFVDWTKTEEEKKKKRKSGILQRRMLQKEKEALFTILLSLSGSIAQSDCKHFVIWYDSRQKDVMRYCVEKEEDIYRLLMKMEGLETPDGDFDIEEEYYQKYHERAFVTKLVLNRRLQLICNEGELIEYPVKDLEKTLSAHTIYL